MSHSRPSASPVARPLRCSVWLAFASDHVEEPAVQAGAHGLDGARYVLAGLVAWWRRPGRFGPLMVAAGFALFLSSLSWANGSCSSRSGSCSTCVAGGAVPARVPRVPERVACARGFERALVGDRVRDGIRAPVRRRWRSTASDPTTCLTLISEPDAARVTWRTSSSSCSARSRLAAIGRPRRAGGAAPGGRSAAHSRCSSIPSPSGS